MKKSYSKNIKRKVIIKLTPEKADEIIKEEFVDDKGNKFIFRVTGNPHSPKQNTINRNLEYNNNKEKQNDRNHNN